MHDHGQPSTLGGAVRQHVALPSDFPAPSCLEPLQALPVAWPPNYEVEFEVMGW